MKTVDVSRFITTDPALRSDPSALLTRFVADADIDLLESKINEVIQEVAQTSLVFAFLDIAGSGLGNDFLCQMKFGSAAGAASSQGLDPANVRVFLYSGSSPEELETSYDHQIERLAALFSQPFPPGTTEFQVTQTLLKGSSQGGGWVGLLEIVFT